MNGLGFRVWGLGFRVWGLGLKGVQIRLRRPSVTLIGGPS